MSLIVATAADFSARHRFSDWPCGDVPAVAAGVYAIWRGDTLVYCGMSGRQFNPTAVPPGKRSGLFTRLASHASGRLSGDQFCVYVANRFVLPSLSADSLPQFASGAVNLDRLTKAFIHAELEFQFVCVDSGAKAFELEHRCRQGHVFAQKPLLNPSQPPEG